METIKWVVLVIGLALVFEVVTRRIKGGIGMKIVFVIFILAVYFIASRCGLL